MGRKRKEQVLKEQMEAQAKRAKKEEPEPEPEEDEDDGIGGIFSGMVGIPSLSFVDKDAAASKESAVEKEKTKLLLAHFNGDQMSRYEAFRRANINRSGVKKLANSVLNQSITGNVAVALSGMSKVFVGEIVEKARVVQSRMDPEDHRELRPLKPEHFREAWRLFKIESGTVPAAHWRRQGGDGDGMMFR
ncbi:hypothetical protein TRVA0_001S03664 [Trichomonascus vanleenenianus]|uniref:TATA-binding protein-associated factor TAF11 n=1 Tax=Trichomonascus vanleenenianus TaxID=2268995 RepID=UPI003ECAB852